MPGAGAGFMRYRKGPVTKKPMRRRYRVPRAMLTKVDPAYRVRVSPPVKRYVKMAIKRQEEKKFAGLTVENGVGHNASISAADIYNILPPIGQGTGYNQRVGEKIRPSSFVVDGTITFNDIGQGYVGVPLSVCVFVLRAKRINDATQITNAPVNVLLDNGQTPTNWDGSTLNSMYPINKDEFEVLGAFRCKVSDITQETSQSLSRRYQMRIKTPAVLDYGYSTSTTTNFAPFLVLGWSRDDAVTPSIGQTWVKHTCTSRLYYTDA